MKASSLWYSVEPHGRSATVTVTLSRCRNCGKVKVASEPCSLDHLAALMEFGDCVRSKK